LAVKFSFAEVSIGVSKLQELRTARHTFLII
jgi:hypothetical protein